MAPLTQTRTMVVVTVALVVLFTTTELLARGYRAARHERAEHHAGRGHALKLEGQYREAADEYRAALSFSPRDFDYRLNLALALMSAQDRREAERHLAELREADPASGVVNLMLARIDAQQDRREAAEAAYHRAIYGFWPEDPQENRLKARFELIALYDRYGDRKKLLGELLEVAAEAPPEPELRNHIGHLLVRYGAPQEAAEVFRESAKLDDEDPDAWAGLGLAERAMGNYGAATAAFRAAQRRAPGDAHAGRLLMETRQAMELDPTGVRLSAAERNRRSRELVRRTLASLERCGPLPPQAAGMAEFARAAVAARPRRGEDDTPQMLAVAEELWRARQATCGAIPEIDRALELVVVRIANDDRA
jgi:tetratricopeptide (TPR) repeat protein